MNATPARTLRSRSHRMSRTRNEARSRTLARWMRLSMASSHGQRRALDVEREDGVLHVGGIGVIAQALAAVRPRDRTALVEQQHAALLAKIAVDGPGPVAAREG